jgi:pSer/pThr/pTyr-binding forkhead associated (FHA) protein
MRFLNLQHTRSDGEIDTYFLKSGRRYRIGRGSACEVRILDVRMSRQHAVIEQQEGQWLFTDTSSTNPARINGGDRDYPCRLNSGDVIHLGNSDLKVLAIEEHLTASTPTVKPELRQNTEDGPHAGTAAIKRGDHVLAQTDQFMAGEKRTIYINVLGKKVGPLTRKEARELKKRELKGELGDDDIKGLLAIG